MKQQKFEDKSRYLAIEALSAGNGEKQVPLNGLSFLPMVLF